MKNSRAGRTDEGEGPTRSDPGRVEGLREEARTHPPVSCFLEEK